MVYEPLRAPRLEEMTVRGLRHRVTWWGERTSTPLVLLHGFQDCGATWQFLVDRLPPEWSLAAPDWRGFGHSEWAAGGYWFPDYLADLDALLDELVPGAPARVIGHSMGANVAQLYAGVRPQRLAWLVNLEGFGLPRTDPKDAPARYGRWLDQLREPLREGRYRSVAQLASFLRSKNPRLPADRAELVAAAWTRPAPPAPSASAPSASAAPADVELLFDPRHRLVNPILYRREEAEACWARVEAPVLLVRGAVEDGGRAQTVRDATDDMRRCIRNLEVVSVPGAGHMVHHEQPEILARHIVDFGRACDSLQARLRAAQPPKP